MIEAPCSSSSSSSSISTTRSALGGARRLALCLFGVAGVWSGKAAEQVKLSPRAVIGAAESHIMHVIKPAEAAGWTVRVFAHSWAGAGSPIAYAVDTAYEKGGDIGLSLAAGARGGSGDHGNRNESWLGGSLHEPYGELTSERVTSMLLSMTASLRLARRYAELCHSPFDLALLLRHDLFFFRPFHIYDIEPKALTLAEWCTWKAAPKKRKPEYVNRNSKWAHCGKFTSARNGTGVMDLFFAASPQLLEFIFGSLQLSRIVRHQRLIVPGRKKDKLIVPPKLVQHRHTSMAHYVIDAHLRKLGLRAQGLVRAHPSAVQHVTFGLFRERDVEAGDFDSASATLQGLTNAGPALCDGRTLCLRGNRLQKELEAERGARWTRASRVVEARFRRLSKNISSSA